MSLKTWKLRVLIALFVSLIIGSLLFFLFVWSSKKVRPTQAGWQSVVITIAGSGAPGFQDSASAMQAQFHDPFGVVPDEEGNLYVTDAGDNNRIRKITPDGQVSTLAGSSEGFADGIGSSAAFNTPSGLAIDSSGNLYVADTGNNRIRKITPEGLVTTLAGDGTPGYRDGPAHEARFNGPVSVAVDARNHVYVADTYNDRIRMVTPDGQVTTLAGGETAGYQDGEALTALFDTPCAVMALLSGDVVIADTGNKRIRKLTKDKQVITLTLSTPEGEAVNELSSPVGLASTFDGFLYVTEEDRGRVLQIAPDGKIRPVAGVGSGFNDGDGQSRARFNQPTGVTVDAHGALYIADSANYLIRKVLPVEDAQGLVIPETADALPKLTAQMLNLTNTNFPWPLNPQQQPHEVVATMGEVRGSYNGESRHHLHSGIDIQAPHGALVRAVFDEKVVEPLCNWGFSGLNEGMRLGLFSYIHMRVGRDLQEAPLNSSHFMPVWDGEGKVIRIRVKRGTRFRVGDVLGSVNRMYHVHLNFGPPGGEVNPLVLPFTGFSDRVAPQIEKDGIQLFNQAGERLTEKRQNRLLVRGEVRILVEAFDHVDRSAARRRLGLYKLGYQVLLPGGTPAPGFEQPRITILFDRLPSDREAVKIAYADESGITVYGSAKTRFLYEATNRVRDGRAVTGYWNTGELPAGDYVLRIIAGDLAGNEATTGRDVPITIIP